MVRNQFTRKFICTLTSAVTFGSGLTVQSAEKATTQSTTTVTAQAKEASGKIRDVKLSEGGVLEMQLVDQNNRPIQDVSVALQFEGKRVATARSDKTGTVRFVRVRSGQHTIQAGDNIQTVRLWKGDAAPPQAVTKLAVTTEEKIVRGQGGGGFLIPTLVTGAVVGTIYSVAETQNLKDEVDALRAASP